MIVTIKYYYNYFVPALITFTARAHATCPAPNKLMARSKSVRLNLAIEFKVYAIVYTRI